MQSKDKTQERATENKEIQSKVQMQQRGEGEEAGRQTNKQAYQRSEIDGQNRREEERERKLLSQS